MTGRRNDTIDAFGNIVYQTGSLENDYQYQTKEYDSQSGIVYFGARYYDPAIGRFTTPDPLGMVDGPNVYVYLSNNPIGFLDPWGLCKGSGASGNWIDDPPLEEDYLFMDVIFDGVDLVALYSDSDLSLGEKAIWTPLIIGPVNTAITKRAVKGAKKIVIGETMERVIERATREGAEWYKPRKLIEPGEEGLKKALKNNYQWLRRKIQQGYEKIDIGIDKAREGGRSIFYAAEKRWLKLWGK